MSQCLICGQDGIDISQDFCTDCSDAVFELEQFGITGKMDRRSLLGMERAKLDFPDQWTEVHERELQALKERVQNNDR